MRWQWNTYFPRKSSYLAAMRTTWPGRTVTVSFQPASPGPGQHQGLWVYNRIRGGVCFGLIVCGLVVGRACGQPDLRSGGRGFHGAGVRGRRGVVGCGGYEVSGGCGVGVLVVCGWNMVMFRWPVLVVLVTELWGKRGWCLRVRSELRCRLVVTRVARIMSAAVRAWAVRAAVEVVAVTRVWVIERVASLRTPVKEIW